MHRNSETPHSAEEKETQRVEAFSDGVFAIAITLLILDLHLSGDTGGLDNGELLAALVRLAPTYLAFLISFAFIGVMWINHHRLFTLIARTDTPLLLLNLLLLLGVTILPFPTALVSEHLFGPGQNTAAAFYNGWFTGIALVFNGLWHYAARGNRLLDVHTDPR